MHGASHLLIDRIERNLPVQQRSFFREELDRPASKELVEVARCTLLDELFWELTYWKTPELYDELTTGEQLHPGIFQQLEPDLRGKVVLDAGAGSGRASFECIRSGAKLVYAVEPSPGLLRILKRKVQQRDMVGKVVPRRGCFDKLPLEENSVDTTVSCSAFTAEEKQGGEAGLAELHRVTKPGGKIVVIWPRTQDYEWLAEHGFQYVALAPDCKSSVRFRSLDSASRCAQRFYARNPNIVRYILERRQSEVPYSVLGFNPPCDYCWLTVE
jgi:FkbM family methyltransferase